MQSYSDTCRCGARLTREDVQARPHDCCLRCRATSKAYQGLGGLKELYTFARFREVSTWVIDPKSDVEKLQLERLERMGYEGAKLLRTILKRLLDLPGDNPLPDSNPDPK